MKTAKDLAFEAFMENVIVNPNEADYDMLLWKMRFENWWSTRYHNNDPYKDHFKPELFVMIDQKVYIQAE